MPGTTDSPDTVSYLRTLPEAECFELLAVAIVGRVGFVSPAGLQIIPMNYRLAPASLLVDLRRNRKRTVRPRTDDQAASTPGDLLIRRQGSVAVSSPLRFRGLLDPLAHRALIDDDIVIVGASVDLNRSNDVISRACI